MDGRNDPPPPDFRARIQIVFVQLLVVHFAIDARLVGGSEPRQSKLFVFVYGLLMGVLLLDQLLGCYSLRL